MLKFLKEHEIVDLTAQLWEQSQKDLVDLQRPFCFGRKDELARLCTHLNTTHKPSNVIVHGQSGVGKSVLIKELARTLLTDKGHVFFHCRVFLMGALCNHLSELKFLAEKVGKQAILVFDECDKSFLKPHLDFSELRKLNFDIGPSADAWKSLLAENLLRIVGLSDRMESFLKEDLARERRFTEIRLKELGIEATIRVIYDQGFVKNISRKYQRKVTFTDEGLRAAIYLSMSIYKDQTLPAKVYNILDPAVNWFLSNHSEATEITEQTMVDYLVEVVNTPREDILERLTEMRDLATSPIPPDTPLAKFTLNLSSRARRGKLAPAWGREKLTNNIATILGAQESNNVLLSGPAGCGKSRIAEGLAFDIYERRLPQLRGREVLLLDWEKVQPHLSEFIESARKYQGRFILVIDEAHRLAGQGGMPNLPDPFSLLANPMGMLSQAMATVGQSDSGAFEALKEPLARGEIPTLALTTACESKRILRDEALNRRFAHISVPLFTAEETVEILGREQAIIEAKFGGKVKIERSGLEALFYLSEIYHKDQFQPASSFKLLHLVCSYANQVEGELVIVDEGFVVRAAAYIFDREIAEVERTLKEEKVSDHPSSRRIPPGEPLRRFTEDLTKEMRKRPTQFSKMRGHELQLDAMKIALSKATCNNVLLIGPAGTGKTTLVKRLAAEMASDMTRGPLQDIPLLSLNLSKLQENPRAFSEFVESAKKYAGQYILFVDEIHRLMGSSTPNFLSLPGLSKEFEELKPLLADGKITLIGAATPDDLRTIPIGDKTITRRFKTILVNPPSTKQATQMLLSTQIPLQQAMSDRLGQNVTYQKATIKKAANMARPQDGLPASAITLLEAAAVRKQMSTSSDDAIVVAPEDLVAEEEPAYFEGAKESPIHTAFKLMNQLSSANHSPRSKKRSRSGFFVYLGVFFSSVGNFFTWPFRKIKIIFTYR